jgi:hypothetical protein
MCRGNTSDCVGHYSPINGYLKQIPSESLVDGTVSPT